MSKVDFSEYPISPIFEGGLHKFADGFRGKLNEVSNAVGVRFFVCQLQ